MDNFTTKFDRLITELQMSKTLNSLLHIQITDLERLSLANSQYLRRKMTEISPVPLELSNDELK